MNMKRLRIMNSASASGTTNAQRLPVRAVAINQLSTKRTDKFLKCKGTINFAAWNVLSGLSLGRKELLVDELIRFNIDVAVLSELRLTDSGSMDIYGSTNFLTPNMYS